MIRGILAAASNHFRFIADRLRKWRGGARRATRYFRNHEVLPVPISTLAVSTLKSPPLSLRGEETHVPQRQAARVPAWKGERLRTPNGLCARDMWLLHVRQDHLCVAVCMAVDGAKRIVNRHTHRR